MSSLYGSIGIALRGIAMGIAEVIPGVSGGTIAFITGIYEKLIDTIKSFGPSLVTVFRKKGIKGLWYSINGDFLIALLGGMGVGVVVGVFAITYILENYPEMLWAFFFGLIAASVWYIGNKVDRWSISIWAIFFVSAIFAYGVTALSPATGSSSYLIIFISGVIAISALMLPGISGSFMLLLMGMYTLIIPAVKSALQTFNRDDLLILVVFGSGCLLGLFTFSRVLSWAFKHHRNFTLSALTGFMLGSLNKIWPWRNVIETRLNSKGENVPFIEKNVFPAAYDGDPNILGVIICLIGGLIVVLILGKFDKSSKANIAS